MLAHTLWSMPMPISNNPTNDEMTISRAKASDVTDVAAMVGELLLEIMNAIGIQAFNFAFAETAERLHRFLDQEKYFVFIARARDGRALGFIALTEGHALYAEGAFGTIPELYVRPSFREQEIGLKLLSAAKSFGATRHWTRLEVTTPPLPQFDRTLAFYEREGFAISGGRKLQTAL